MKLFSPLFAMGPAWTLMRAISGHVPDEIADEMTFMLQGKDKERGIAQLRETKQRESQGLFDALDFWSGNADFEMEVRAAVLRVVEEFGPRRSEWGGQSGRRRRARDD